MDWIALDKKLIWHPYTPQKSNPEPVFIEKGSGSWLYDKNGKAYLDAISSWWVTIHGHSHPHIAQKIYEQALKLEHTIFAGFTHQPAIELAARLLPRLPGDFSKIFYSDNGSTATEVAIKMAIQFWWNQQNFRRKKILAFKNSYHGDTFGAMSVSDRSIFTRPFEDHLFEVRFIDTPHSGNISALKELLYSEGENIAAFIYEPLVQGAGGMKMYGAEFLDELLGVAREKEVICIADEVMTGFGRTGKFFASEWLRIQPDIICLSKGLTGGVMALGITACNEKIYQAYYQDDKTKTFFHGHSFTANPMACAAALASLDLMDQGAMQNMAEICHWNAMYLEKLRNQYNTEGSKIRNLRQLGTILAFEINLGEDAYLNQVGPEIIRRSLNAGVYLRPLGNTIYFMPPYCLLESEHQFLTKTTDDIIQAF